MSGLPPDVADEKRKGCKPMSDKLLFWVNKAFECEEENKRLEQRINLLQIAGDEAIKQRNDALRERDEARAENKRLRDRLFLKCEEAEKLPNGQCRGFQVSHFDDEPIEQCKNCQKFDLYDPEELVEDCPEDWDEEGEHDD